MKMSIILLLMIAITSVWCTCDPASFQLYKFKKETCAIPVLTTGNGAPVEVKDTVALNSDMLSNEVFMEMMTHLLEERIPERIVHVKGTAAHGYFIVTNDVSRYCKAKFLSKVGKRTPVLVRFSPTSLDKGEADSLLDSRGMACKFYSEEGNFDLVMFHTPMFSYKEPFMCQNIGKTIKRNPVTNIRDSNGLWDIITTKLECINFFMYLFGENGIPNTFRHMPGFSCHTYQVYNEQGESYFWRWHVIPDEGISNLCTKQALKLIAADPDYAIRDLYNYIEKCKYDKNCKWPTWTVKLQILTMQQVKEAKLDVFDLTKILPEKDYPLIECGKIYLNRNPRNHFAEVEQAAFCPGNLVPGILGAPDKAFISRRFAYKDAQRYRLGVNFNKIEVNRPHIPVNNYDRDGNGACCGNGGSGPSFFQNTFHGPLPYVDNNRPALINITQFESEADNLGQTTELYEELSIKSRDILAQNIVTWSLGQACDEMQYRAVKLFEKIHPDLARRVVKALIDAAAEPKEDEDNCPCKQCSSGNK